MSFLLDPPMLILLGMAIYILGKELGWGRYARIAIGATITLIFVGFSTLLYLDWVRCVFPYFCYSQGSQILASEFMFQTNWQMLYLGKIIVSKANTPHYIVALIFLVFYPIFMLLGYSIMNKFERDRTRKKVPSEFGINGVEIKIKKGPKTKVVSVKSEDGKPALDEVLDKTGFFKLLDKRFHESGKTKEDFSIVIKPNIMMAYSKEDMSVITDPKLVEHLIDRIAEKGYSNLTVIESQNVFGNWFENRDVKTVAKYIGYSENKNYKIVDITEEKVPYRYGGRLGMHWVGPTWRDADFRISFAKNKTHFGCYFTLTIKNIYGTTPLQNKFLEYHKIREFDWPTIEMLKQFPVHFAIIDGIWSADGLLGIKADYTPKHTKTVIGGESIVAVDHVGASKMGLDPMKSNIFKLAVGAFGMPEIDLQESDNPTNEPIRYEDWDNVPPLFDKFLDVGEEWYGLSNWLGFVSTGIDEKAFPIKDQTGIKYWISVLLRPLRPVVLRILKIISHIE
ncbi:MAG: DUF362 domain-containing protein [Candidatus Hydrothermarchaeales archaeon]